MHCPSTIHWSAAKRVLRFLKATIHHGLFLKPHQSVTLTSCKDVDWAGDRDDRKFTSAYIIYLGGNAISWCSKKQNSVARSSTEDECQALVSCAMEVLWLTNLLSELHVNCSSAPNSFCDNIGTAYLSVNPVFHIAIDFHFVRDHVARGSLLSEISTKN